MSVKQQIFALLCCILLTACTLPAQPTAWTPAVAPTNASPAPTTSLPTQTAAPIAPTTPSATASTTSPPTATPTTQPVAAFIPPASPRTQYKLEATLDYAAHNLVISQQITYTNTTPGALSELPLVVEARRYPGVFDLDHLDWADGVRIQDYYWTDTRLNIILPQALAVGETVSLSIAYTLYLFDSSKQPNVRPYPLGYTTSQTNLGDWYPFVPPYNPANGWLIHRPNYYGEHLVYDSADFQVSIRTTGRVRDVVIAASTPAQEDGEWLNYQAQALRSFAWSASPYYQVSLRQVELDGHIVNVASYHMPAYQQAGDSLAETMTQALQVYSELYGTYPHSLLSAVQAEFLDGMEYDGLFFLGSNFFDWYKEDPAQFLTMLGAHETAHQWWYGLVGNDQALEPWLDEALCTYSERLYYEHMAPQALEWWWGYRIHYYEPGGWIDMSIYDLPNEAGRYRLYRDTVYLNGALFMEDLRLLMGDEAFFAALKDYARAFSYTQSNTAGFFAILRQHTSADLGALPEKYFKNPP